MALSKVIASCIAQWESEGIRFTKPIPREEVIQTWALFDKQVSDDVVELYTSIGGFQDNQFDEEFFWALWPWELLKDKNSNSSNLGVQFCDHSLEIETWEIRYVDKEHSSVWSTSCGSTTEYLTAPTLEAFFTQYLEDPWKLL